jgi:SAM-dependent methyltransferase
MATGGEADDGQGCSERRFRGAMSEDYLLVRGAVLAFDEFQRLVAEAVAAHPSPDPSAPLRVLDLGCGDGVTAGAILSRRPDALLTALDSEEAMATRASENLAGFIREGRCRVVRHDALAHLRNLPASCFEVVASALALHNLPRGYRQALHREVHRVLGPGGLFANADKYARDDGQRFERLRGTLERFFDAFVPLGKLDLLRACVLHEVADEEPLRVMWEGEVVPELVGIGFRDVEVRRPHPLAALLVATRPGSRGRQRPSSLTSQDPPAPSG